MSFTQVQYLLLQGKKAWLTQLDMKTDNIMLSLDSSKLLADFEQSEIQQPSSRKVIDESRTIYESQNFAHQSRGRAMVYLSFVILERQELERCMSPAHSYNRVFIGPPRLYSRCHGEVLLIFGTWEPW